MMRLWAALAVAACASGLEVCKPTGLAARRDALAAAGLAVAGLAACKPLAVGAAGPAVAAAPVGAAPVGAASPPVAAAPVGAAAPAAAPPLTAAPAPPPVATVLTVNEAIRRVVAEGDAAWRRAAEKNGYVYRGVDAARPTLRREPSDLFDPATYGSADAARWFRDLDARVGLVRDGHLAVPDAAAAAAWGPASSVWPLGETHYAWSPDFAVFWPAAAAPAAPAATALRVDEGLADCVRLGHEVLFVCESFVAVPLPLEGPFRAGLARARD